MFDLQRNLLLTFLAGRGKAGEGLTVVDAGPRVLLVVLGCPAHRPRRLSRGGRGGGVAGVPGAGRRELVDEGRPASRSLAVIVADTAPYLSVATFLRVSASRAPRS